MSDENVVSIFEQFRSKEAGQQPASTQETYQAASIERPGRQANSIRIHFSNGYIHQISYAHRKYELSVSPENLSIIFTTGAARLVGKHLRALLDDLQDERISLLQPFNPALHKLPKEGAPLIESIEWMTAEEIRNAKLNN